MDSYDFSSKHIYRTRRVVAIDRMCSKHKSLRKVAYLDTGEALDTISYLRRGYSPSNLWAVNRNPAEVATLSRTLDNMGLPRVHTVGLDFEDALSRRIPDVDIIDFDGMSNLHDKMLAMLGRISMSRPDAVYGVTLMAARETNQGGIYRACIKNTDDAVIATSFGTRTTTKHSERLSLALLFGLNGRPMSDEMIDTRTRRTETEEQRILREYKLQPCRVHHSRIMWDVYVSASKQPMLWFVVACSRHVHLHPRDVQKIALGMRVSGHVLSAPHCVVGYDNDGAFGSRLAECIDGFKYRGDTSTASAVRTAMLPGVNQTGTTEQLRV